MSFTRLKWSMSTSRIAAGTLSRRARRIHRSASRCQATALSRPVFGSDWAAARSCWCSRLRWSRMTGGSATTSMTQLNVQAMVTSTPAHSPAAFHQQALEVPARPAPGPRLARPRGPPGQGDQDRVDQHEQRGAARGPEHHHRIAQPRLVRVGQAGQAVEQERAGRPGQAQRGRRERPPVQRSLPGPPVRVPADQHRAEQRVLRRQQQRGREPPGGEQIMRALAAALRRAGSPRRRPSRSRGRPRRGPSWPACGCSRVSCQAARRNSVAVTAIRYARSRRRRGSRSKAHGASGRCPDPPRYSRCIVRWTADMPPVHDCRRQAPPAFRSHSVFKKRPNYDAG